MLIAVNSFQLPNMTPKEDLTYDQFLQTTKVVRMLYGLDLAKKYFTDNLHLWYNKDNS